MPSWSRLRGAAPFDTLPVELISYIFVLTLESEPDLQSDDDAPSIDSDSPSVNMEAVTFPLVLSTVSTRWRTIALSTPALWTSICVSIQHVVDLDDQSVRPMLDTTHLVTNLSLSGRYPLNILIDARDPDWDFTEQDSFRQMSGSLYMSSSHDRAPKYIHPFTSSHMNSAFKMLLPHLQRWRSLTVLTDTWEQMHAALAKLSNYDAWDAPQLESLTLMRCNEFASYTDFHPAHKRDYQWLPLGRSIMLDGGGKPLPLPRLRSLNLTGVHLHWESLPLLLTPQAASPPSLGLQSLILKYHPRDVRPSSDAFCDLLRACPDLRSLSVVVSGPLPDVEDEDALVAIPLLHLVQLHIGYTTAHHACHLLRLLAAPKLQSLSLEDATHIASPFEPDAKAILYYLSTGRVVISQTVLTDQPTSNPPYDMDSLDNIHPPFPQLQEAKMVGVKAPEDAFSLFFRAHSQLQSLDMSRSSTDACRGLLPQSSTSPTTDPPDTFIPCPLLHKLCVRGAYLDIDFIAALPAVRAESGCRRLRHVAVYVDPDLASEGTGSIWDDDSSDGGEDDEIMSDRGSVDHDMVAVDCSTRWGTAVRVYRSPRLHKLKVDELDLDCEYATADPYAPGGAFNDPEFDEYYSRRQLWPAASGAG